MSEANFPRAAQGFIAGYLLARRLSRRACIGHVRYYLQVRTRSLKELSAALSEATDAIQGLVDFIEETDKQFNDEFEEIAKSNDGPQFWVDIDVEEI